MDKRERFVIYPLMLLCVGFTARETLTAPEHLAADRITCRHLVVESDQRGRQAFEAYISRDGTRKRVQADTAKINGVLRSEEARIIRLLTTKVDLITNRQVLTLDGQGLHRPQALNQVGANGAAKSTKAPAKGALQPGAAQETEPEAGTPRKGTPESPERKSSDPEATTAEAAEDGSDSAAPDPNATKSE